MATNFYDAANWLSGQLGGKRSDAKWRMAPCPVHDDRKPSLAIGAFDGGVYVKCHVGCAPTTIKDALISKGLYPIPFENFRTASPHASVPAAQQKSGPVTPRQKTDAERIAGARAIWDAANPLNTADPDNPAFLYLEQRGIAAAIGSPEIRYLSHCPNPDGGKYPALVCRVVDVRGRFRGVHAVYVRRNGEKTLADIKKASWGPIGGGAIRFGGIAPEIVIAEGPETAMSAGILLGLPAWSAIDAGNMGRLKLPKEIRSIVIVADNDAVNVQTGKSPGISAAHAAYRRWQHECRKVLILKSKTPREDFNDVLLRLAAGEANAA